MRLSQLRDFIGIVEAGSIRAAARRRGVSQPVLTKSLRTLEADVGARLLQRTAQGIVLTPPGRALLARARAVHTQLEKAREEIAQIGGDRHSSVAFGASASGLVLVTEALRRFRAVHPRSHVRIVEGAPHALLPLLRDERLDFFVGPRPAVALDPGVRTRPLFRLPLAVAGRRGHPLRSARTLAALREAPWLLLSAGGWADSILGSSFKAAGLERPGSLVQCESYSTTLSLLSQTDTLALIPRAHLAGPGLRGVVEEIAVTDRIPDLVFVTYLRADDAPTGAASMLMRTLSAVASGMMAETRGARPAS